MKLLSLTFILLAGLYLPARAANESIQGHILGIPGSAVSVDMDVFHELKPGDIGILNRNGVRIASVEVVRVEQENVFLRALDSARDFAPQAGDIAYFTTADHPSAGTGAGAGLGGEDLVPLLTPVAEALPEIKKPARKVSSRTRGRIQAREFYQTVTPGNYNQRITRADTDGAVDRIGGGPWSFQWSGNGSYLDGNRTSASSNFRNFQPRARRLAFSRPLGENGFLTAGRFFPKELPGLGTVDGAAAEARAGWLNVGAVAGARPERRLQGFSSHELLGAVYASAAKGTPGKGSYAATLGLMHTTWLGKSDELAALFDHNFDLGPLLSVYQTVQVDVNDDAAKFNEGARLTRMDLSANSTLKKWLTLRGGVNHYEPIDTAAERAFIGGDSLVNIDNGYWRWWVGSGQTLPWGLGLDEEISWTDTQGKMQPGLWRATLWRQGLPWLPEGNTYLTVYNVAGLHGDDYGSAAGLTLPLLEGKFIVDAGAGFHYDRSTSSRRNLKLGDASLRLDWRPSKVWQLDTSLSKVWSGATRSYSLSCGLSYRR
ncbi:MAG: hypothetical protein PHV36_13200 [Elusimicrobiales bacterium]|nr:hypothetical protein [Elusimicrobiales bacterium]